MNWKIWQRWQNQGGVSGLKTTSGRRWWLVAIGAIVFLFGGWLLMFSGIDSRENVWVAFGFIVLLASGGYGIYLGFKQKESSIVRKKTKQEKQEEKLANTINICVKKVKNSEKYRPFKIEFTEQTEDCKGALILVENFNKYFYVNNVFYNEDGEIEKREDFELPDGEFLSPRKYLIPLYMKAWENLIRHFRSRSPFQQVKVWAMIAAFGITTLVFWLTLAG